MTLDLFFYGLFMDTALLTERGLKPTVLGSARLDDYILRIGERAAVVPVEGGSCFGVLMQLEADEVDRLYSEPSVHDYQPKTLEITRLPEHGGSKLVPAVCYTLPLDSIGEKVNRDYVRSLARLAADLQLPIAYVDEIEKLGSIPRANP